MNAIQEREPACPSRLRFDRLLAGELESVQARELSAHAAGCARCNALLAELRRGHEAFATAAVLPDAIARRVRERAAERGRDLAWPRWAAPLLAAAAVLITWTAWPPGSPQAPTLGERTKGGEVHLSFYVMHDGAVRPG